MMNIMEIKGYKAIINYDQEIEMFRGEFIDLNGGADFYAKDIDTLRREGDISLKEFLRGCAEWGIEPRKIYSGKLMLRIPPVVHAKASAAAAAAGKSLNAWVAEVLNQAAIS